ncbi:sulfotransferase family protein [Novosphingobium profundi]|nr:sulfotransferase family protein [Novosphingobium profundi]
MRGGLREKGKRGLGWVAGWTLPSCRYARCIFVLAHMRCGSTALSNILCSRPDFSGYGETHVFHDGLDAPGRLAVNCIRRGSWKRNAPWQFDKILHSRLDRHAPDEFFAARAIFVAREPVATIRSIVTLYRTLGRPEYRDHADAARYYIERLDALAGMWHRFAPERRVGITHRSLMAEPDAILAATSGAIGIEPPLKNAYRSHAASRRGGGGDPLVSGSYSRIEAALPVASGTREFLDVPDTLLDLAVERYAKLEALFRSEQTVSARNKWLESV